MASPNQQEAQGTFSRDEMLALFNRRVNPIVSAAATLTVAQSGSICLLNAAAGILYTLPVITAADVGVNFRFVQTVTITSGAAKVITGAASSFLLGSVFQAIEATTPGANPGPKDFVFNGSTHVAISMNGTTSGGVIGTDFTVTALSPTQWFIQGYVKASGTIETPAATS